MNYAETRDSGVHLAFSLMGRRLAFQCRWLDMVGISSVIYLALVLTGFTGPANRSEDVGVVSKAETLALAAAKLQVMPAERSVMLTIGQDSVQKWARTAELGQVTSAPQDAAIDPIVDSLQRVLPRFQF